MKSLSSIAYAVAEELKRRYLITDSKGSLMITTEQLASIITDILVRESK